ncbi:hypothetical protein IHE44_0006437, partial [Lamprotornis superbus]
MVGLKEELLKSIWHAFTALDLDRSGKVLSHNLCTVLNVPHDPVALEEHFRDDDEGPVSNQGYMPYLNKFILEKVQGNFDKVEFNRMCWTLCAKKNLSKSPLLISDEDAFKVWVIFNFLSEDKYPLIIVPEEIEYLLKKITEAMGAGWQQEQFDHYKIALNTSREGLSAWELIDLIGSGQFSKGMDRQTVSMAINEVFNELILDVLKQGYMLKKGHKRKNWMERWFVLKPNIISYYVSEDLKDKKGDIILDGNCCVEALPDKDGKKCLFLIKCLDKTFEISASDKKKKQEWIQGIPPVRPSQICDEYIHLQSEVQALAKLLLLMPLKNVQQLNICVLSFALPSLPAACVSLHQTIQSTVSLLRAGSPPPHKEARQKRKELRQKLLAEQEELERQMKELQAANENKQKELETVRKQLEAAAARAAEEEKKRLQTQVELQDRFSLELEREKMVRQQMEEQVAQKSSELEQYLQRVRELEEMYKQLQEALEDEKQAPNNTKSWKDKVAHHEGLIRLIEPGSKNPHLITNWGPAAFTEAELEERQRSWKGKKATSELGLSAHEILFTTLEGLLRAQPLQWVKVREAVVLLVQFSIISAQDKSVLEVMSNSEMEHYLSFLLTLLLCPSVALCRVLSAQAHSLGKGGLASLGACCLLRFGVLFPSLCRNPNKRTGDSVENTALHVKLFVVNKKGIFQEDKQCLGVQHCATWVLERAESVQKWCPDLENSAAAWGKGQAQQGQTQQPLTTCQHCLSVCLSEVSSYSLAEEEMRR